MTHKPSVDPRIWQPPPATGPTGRALPPITVYQVNGQGAEDVLVLPDGRVVTGVADGRILAVAQDGSHIARIGDTGGRPLGLESHPDGSLVICDARKGLLRMDVATGDIETLATGVEGRPFMFCNNAAVSSDGTIYFTDSSRRFGIDHWRADLIEHSASGRLLKRDPDGQITTVLDGLAFANGVALAPDESYVVVAETAAYALRRLWLTGPRAGADEPFGHPLPAFPDNISTGSDGQIWVTLASPRDKVLDLLLPRAAILRRVVWALPRRLQPNPQRAFGVRAYDDAGSITFDVWGDHERFHLPTGVREHEGRVWMGSLEEPAVAVMAV